MKFFKYCHFIAAAAWIAILAYMQISLLPDARNCILEKAGVGALESGSRLADAARVCLGTEIIAASALLGILTIGLAAIIWKHFDGIYGHLERRKKEWLIATVIIAAVALPYLSKGNVVLGDAMQFSALSIYLKEALMSLTYPFWTFYWYMGSAPLAFYGWLHLLATGIASSAFGIDAANKALFYAMHLASVLFAYKFVKEATKNSKIAVIAALFFGLSFEHMARIMVGRSITATTYLLTPLLFWIYEKRLNGKLSSAKAVAAAALVTAMLVFNHQADGAFIIAVFLAYAALRAFEADRSSVKRLGTEVAAAMILGAAITAFWTVPMLIESGQASATGKAIEILEIKPDAGLAKEAVAWPGKWGDRQLYYIGISGVILGILGIYYLTRHGKPAIAAATAISAALVLLQSPRYAPAMLLLLGAAAGYGMIFMSGRLKIDSGKMLLLIAVVMVADLAPATAQLGYPDFSHNMQFYDTIDAKDGERVLDLSTDRRTFWPSLAYINNRAETVFGTLVESAPKSLSYAAAIAQKAAVEYYDKQEEFSEGTLDAMHLLGVKHVIVHEEQPGKNASEVFASKRGALGLGRGLALIELNHSVIVASGRKERISHEPLLERQEGWNLRTLFEEREIDDSEIERIVEEMEVNTATATAEKILVKEGNGEEISSSSFVTVIDVTTTPGKVTINYESSEAFLQLSYSHSPHLSVKIDGQEVRYWKSAIDTIAVRTPEGKHSITIEGKQSGLRKMLMPASLIAFLAALGMLLTNRKI